jgi:F0F1-type ATP synthase assembly protein I
MQMRTLLTLSTILALAAAGWVIDRLALLEPLSLLALLVMLAGSAYAGAIYRTASLSDAEAARRRRTGAVR